MLRDNPAINKMVADMTALARAGIPDDIGPMIAALLSDDNGWVNGQRIEVSGGMSLGVRLTVKIALGAAGLSSQLRHFGCDFAPVAYIQ